VSVWTVLLVAAGAAVGAPLRYLIDITTKVRLGDAFPWGTFAVNVAGSFVLGALAGAATALPIEVHAAIGTGLCGTATTYSTFSYEVVALAERRIAVTPVTYLLVSVVSGVLAAALGWAAGDLVA
jgi:CrcB protein